MKPSSNGRNNSTVQSIDRAVHILDVLCQAETPMSLAAISSRLGLHRPTVFRLLHTLSEHSLVARDPLTKNYIPGFRIFEWSSEFTRKLDLRTQALPELRELSERTNETVHLAVLDQSDVIYIDKHESRQAIRMYSAIGLRAPAYSTAVGKVLLAHLTPAQTRHSFRGQKEISGIDAQYDHYCVCAQAGVCRHTGAAMPSITASTSSKSFVWRVPFITSMRR